MGLNDSWRAAIAAGAVNLVVGANLPYLPVWMDKIGGMSGAEIAGAGTLAALIRIVAGPLAAGRAQSHGLRATLATVMAVCLAGYALLAGAFAAVIFQPSLIHLIANGFTEMRGVRLDWSVANLMLALLGFTLFLIARHGADLKARLEEFV